jgi:hypothetical protein
MPGVVPRKSYGTPSWVSTFRTVSAATSAAAPVPPLLLAWWTAEGGGSVACSLMAVSVESTILVTLD